MNISLADSFGRAGLYTVMPDLFDGEPAPGDIAGTPSFNVTEFLEKHNPTVTDPKIEKAIKFLRSKGVKKIAVSERSAVTAMRSVVYEDD
jgi:dienelactone hydrolase